MERATLFVVSEGHSEHGFFKPLLAEYLGVRGIDLHVPVIGRGNAKGGLKYRSFQQVCEELGEFLADRRQPHVTTFFDYYGLPSGGRLGWDWVPQAKERGGVAAVEGRMRDGVAAVAGERVARFIPYVQLHELEALFFAEPAVLAEVLEAPERSELLAQIVERAGGCEAINDSPTTAPSKRLQALCPKYVKGRSSAAHAPRLGRRLSLATVRAACPRFHGWLEAIERLTPPL